MNVYWGTRGGALSIVDDYIGVIPADGREDLWLDKDTLYMLDHCDVELYFVEG